jgi:serine/threonine protein kinase
MERKIDPSTVETTLEARAPVRPPSSSSVSQLTSSSVVDEGRFVAGTLLGGRYRIIGLLGRGGMGEVYRATDMMLGQSVALKFLPVEASSNPRLLERFHGEVRVARQVSHPNVCRVYDIGEIEGMPFISMEYVDGEDLAALLLRIGRLPSR